MRMQFTKKLAQISALLYNAFTACAVLLSVKQMLTNKQQYALFNKLMRARLKRNAASNARSITKKQYYAAKFTRNVHVACSYVPQCVSVNAHCKQCSQNDNCVVLAQAHYKVIALLKQVV